jgi:membrane peptidoglycan carboxypeptidase
VLASGGEWRAPRLVAARREPDGVWERLPVSAPRRVLRPAVARAVLGMLETVVGPEGTGRRAGLRGIRVAGKTGTAQKLEPDGTYSQGRYQAWFVGAAPADAPRFVIAALVDEPRGFVHTGGATAAPLFARVAAAALARDGILTEPELPLPEWARADWVPPWEVAASKPAPATKVTPAVASAPPRATERPRLAAAPQAAQPSEADRRVQAGRSPARSGAKPSGADSSLRAQRAASEGSRLASGATRLGDRILLPDFRGLTPDEVRRELAGLGIALQVSGNGRAVAQEPAPGTIVRGGSVRVHFGAGGGAR